MQYTLAQGEKHTYMVPLTRAPEPTTDIATTQRVCVCVYMHVVMYLFRGHNYSMVALFRGHSYSMVAFGILIADIQIIKFCLKIPHSPPLPNYMSFLFLHLYTP